MNYCEWTGLTKGSKCISCGYILRRDYQKPPKRVCSDDSSETPIYLGTKIKHGLDAAGITQDRVAALVEAIGLPPQCFGCAKRQEKLDEYDRKTREWLAKAKAWFKGTN